MIRETVGNTGKVPREVSADVGYYSAQVVDGLYALGEDPFVAPDQTCHGRVVPPAPGGAYQAACRPGTGYAPEAAYERGTAALCVADGAGGAGVRADQGKSGVPAVPAAWLGADEPGVAAHLHRPQPAQALPVRPQGHRLSVLDTQPPVGNGPELVSPRRRSSPNRPHSAQPQTP